MKRKINGHIRGGLETRFRFIVVLFIIAVLASACGQSGSAATTGATQAPGSQGAAGGQAEAVPGLSGKSTAAGSSALLPMMQLAATQFQQANKSVQISVTARGSGAGRAQVCKYVLETARLNVYYGSFRAVRDIDLKIERRKITALIGSSGCGKSTVLRSFNRMNDLVSTARVEGRVSFRGKNIYDPDVAPAEVRRRIGMVFQRPNSFPKSIYDNLAWGARVAGYPGNMNELVEESLRDAALWDEVKDKLGQSALALSGGQQQRLCIARAIATRPDIVLMDEPASALDPIATLKIEDLMRELAQRYTIVIVTHNMQQAARVSDYTAFLIMGEDRAGYLVEYGETNGLFTNPKNRLTEDYITGRFG